MVGVLDRLGRQGGGAGGRGGHRAVQNDNSNGDDDDDSAEKGGAVGDFCTVLCCPGCAHLQQYKEVNLYHQFSHLCQGGEIMIHHNLHDHLPHHFYFIFFFLDRPPNGET